MPNLTRRDFIVASVAASGGLLLSIAWTRSAKAQTHRLFDARTLHGARQARTIPQRSYPTLDGEDEHVDPASTTVYLTVTAELLEMAGNRFERFAAPLSTGRAP